MGKWEESQEWGQIQKVLALSVLMVPFDSLMKLTKVFKNCDVGIYSCFFWGMPYWVRVLCLLGWWSTT
jgi:hypothetical protein